MSEYEDGRIEFGDKKLIIKTGGYIYPEVDEHGAPTTALSHDTVRESIKNIKNGFSIEGAIYLLECDYELNTAAITRDWITKRISILEDELEQRGRKFSKLRQLYRRGDN